jgi:hypothetical protein
VNPLPDSLSMPNFDAKLTQEEMKKLQKAAKTLRIS